MKMLFNTKQEMEQYIATRKYVPRSRFSGGKDMCLRPEHQMPFPEGQDDLLLRICYATAEQPDGRWMLVF